MKIYSRIHIPMISALCLAWSIFFLLPAHALSRELFVDRQLSSNCPGNYNPKTRACNESGSRDAYSDLDTAVSTLRPGDVLNLRQGSYTRLNITTSGTVENPITIRSYPRETAVITNNGSEVALWLIQRHDIIINGLEVRNAAGHGRLEESTRITIKNTLFTQSQSSGTTGSLKFVRSTYNHVNNCTFTDSNSDAVVIQDNSDYNIFEGNKFNRAEHSLLSIRCSNYNIFRNNDFANPNQKAIEIYDCEGISDAPVRLDSTKHNLFENNRITDTKASDRDYRYNAIQHGAQYTIVRKNVFRNCEGGGVNYQSYSDESLYVYGNRLYNNTFYNNSCYGIIGNSGSSSQYYDNRVVNNLLYKNTSCNGAPAQVSINDPDAVILDHNVLATDDPGFIDADANDFSLTTTSPVLDAGTFITHTNGSGSGTTIPVDDAAVFFDGFGIPEEIGDIIQFEGSQDTERILSIDYQNKTLTLDKAVTWTDGQGISLRYSGNAPAVGAFEGTTDIVISTPTGLRIAGNKTSE